MRIYTRATRLKIIADAEIRRYLNDPMVKATLNFYNYREQAFWLVGDKHPKQRRN